MPSYQTRFSFSFSVSEKAGEFIKQGLEYFCGNEEAEFGPEWQAEFATTNAKVKSGVATPDDWANDESGETRTGCEYQVELVDGQAVFSVWAEEHGSVDLTASIIVTGLQLADDDTVVTFEYANTCSKPEPDAFGGGACAVSKSRYLDRGTSTLAAQLAKDVVN